MKPNIIVYFTDQQRFDTVNERVMPKLCEYLENGAKFDNAFTCQPVCGPARACIQTGVYATQNKCYVNAISLPQSEDLLAKIMRRAGYDTAYVGKWHLASDRTSNHFETVAIPEDRRGGYEYWRAADVLEFTSNAKKGYVFDENNNKIEFDGYRVDCINDFAEEYIRNHSGDKPYFLFVSQLEPHHQNNEHRFCGYEATVDNFKNEPIPTDLLGFSGNYRESYPDYLSAINRIDYNLDKIVEAVKDKGEFDDTIIIFTSDHGCHFKTRNMEYKRSPHDSCTHIPMCIFGGYINRWFEGGMTSDAMVSLLDLPATALDLAGETIPPHYSGKSMVNVLKRNENINHECVFMQISESQIGRAIRTPKYLYAVKAGGFGYVGMLKYSAKHYFEAYLYDIETDPDQKRNLIRNVEYRAVRSELRETLINEMILAGEEKPKIHPAVFVRKI